MRVGTICARNYLGSAMLLVSSLRTVHPDWSMTVLLIDIEVGDKLRYQEDYPDVTWLAPEDLRWSNAVLDRMKLYYDVIELATALKPALLELLLRDDEVAMYLDPDIEVFESLSELEELARTDEIVLLPHVTMPVPRDGFDPNEETFLLSGQFNLGFVAVSRAAAPFLEYWNERLELHSRIDHSRGYFTDQRWVDAVPSLFRHTVVREPGYNVAYWNLHELELSYSSSGTAEGDVLVNGEPLRFFHYSGHSPKRPLELSKFAPNPRVSVEDDLVLRDILIRRAARMESEAIPSVPYRWNRLPDGRPIPPELRQGYWLEVSHAFAASTEMPPTPFGDPIVQATFDRWIEEAGELGLPRLAELFWRGSEVLQQAFPDLLEGRIKQFTEAILNEQGFLGIASRAVLESIESSGGEARRSRPGFNISISKGEGSSLQAFSLEVAQAIRAAGLPLSMSDSLDDGMNLVLGSANPYTLSVVDFAMGGAGELHEGLEGPPGSSPKVALVTLEALRAATSFEAELDEIWCESASTRSLVSHLAPGCPIEVVPRTVQQSHPPGLTRGDLGFGGEDLVFGVIQDQLDGVSDFDVERAVIAYLEAFQGADGCRLVVQRSDPLDAQRWSRILAITKTRSDVVFVGENWGEVERRAALHRFDVFVSLHSQLGRARDLFDAMASGTVALATRGSSNLDFMTDENSVLVPTEEGARGSQGASERTPTCIPNAAMASLLMRELAERSDERRLLGERARQDLQKRFCLEETQAWVSERFERLMERNGWRR
jgi:hypothetical protein